MYTQIHARARTHTHTHMHTLLNGGKKAEGIDSFVYLSLASDWEEWLASSRRMAPRSLWELLAVDRYHMMKDVMNPANRRGTAL